MLTLVLLRDTPLSVVARHAQCRGNLGGPPTNVVARSRRRRGNLGGAVAEGIGACAVFPCPLSAEIASSFSGRTRKDNVGLPTLLRCPFAALRASAHRNDRGLSLRGAAGDVAISLSIGLTHHGVTQQVSLLNLHSRIKERRYGKAL